MQTVSGAPPTAFWASVYIWDLINYAISAAGNPIRQFHLYQDWLLCLSLVGSPCPSWQCISKNTHARYCTATHHVPVASALQAIPVTVVRALHSPSRRPCLTLSLPMCVANVCLCDDAGIVLCFQVFGLAQFTGERLTAVTVLLALFGLASLPLTYFLHFFFTVSPPSSS